MNLYCVASPRIKFCEFHEKSFLCENTYNSGLMIMASHQTFSGQLWHLTDQTKFDQTNLLYIINGEVYKFTIGKQMSGQFSTFIISTDNYESVSATSDVHYMIVYRIS